MMVVKPIRTVTLALAFLLTPNMTANMKAHAAASGPVCSSDFITGHVSTSNHHHDVTRYYTILKKLPSTCSPRVKEIFDRVPPWRCYIINVWKRKHIVPKVVCKQKKSIKEEAK